jgi:hypothetical protein
MKKEKHDALIALAVAMMGDPLAAEARSELREALTADPMQSALLALLVGSHLFYQAEKGQNPKVNTIGDALVLVSTSFSVGSGDNFAVTEKGKLIVSALTTYGPALGAQILNPPAAETAPSSPAESLAAQREIVAKLDAILEELRAARLAATPATK